MTGCSAGWAIHFPFDSRDGGVGLGLLDTFLFGNRVTGAKGLGAPLMIQQFDCHRCWSVGIIQNVKPGSTVLI